MTEHALKESGWGNDSTVYMLKPEYKKYYDMITGEY